MKKLTTTSTKAAKKAGTARPISPDDIEAWLRKQPPEKLVETIMAQALSDGDFYNLLKFQMAANAPARNRSDLRAVLCRAMTIEGFVSWRETSAYSSGVERVLARVRDMLTDHPAEVAELTEYAIDLWEEAIQRIDDSDGGMGMILDDLHRLHLEACRKSKPDPIALADRLFDRHVRSEWDMFSGAYETYGPLLRKEGKARFRERIEGEWKKLPRYGPGKKNEDRYGRSRKIHEMMLSVAEESKDLDRIVEVMSRDLSEPYDHLAIAERCRQAKAYDRAREWAEQGLRAFPEHRDHRLHDFLAEEYARARRPEDAVSVIWETFAACPTLERYQKLATSAAKAKAWPDWRARALDHARTDIAARKQTHARTRDRWSAASDHSLLVEIFLWEKDAETAWAEAQAGGCSNALWLELASAREASHPADAAAIHRRQVEPLLSRKNKDSYQAAVHHLDKLHALMLRMGREADFHQELLAIKAEWKRLRNFIKYVERKKWGKVAG